MIESRVWDESRRKSFKWGIIVKENMCPYLKSGNLSEVKSTNFANTSVSIGVTMLANVNLKIHFCNFFLPFFLFWGKAYLCKSLKSNYFCLSLSSAEVPGKFHYSLTFMIDIWKSCTSYLHSSNEAKEVKTPPPELCSDSSLKMDNSASAFLYPLELISFDLSGSRDQAW